MCYNHIIFIGKEISKNGKKPMKKFFSRFVCVMTAAVIMSGFAVRSCADDEYDIVIDISKDRMPISKYIYGINDVYGLDGLTASSVKQSDVRISSYNWETNTSNSAAENGFENDFSLVSGNTKTPALLTDNLVSRAEKYGIPSKYVTLQMMGLVANDSSGVYSPGDPERRFASVVFSKNDSLLTEPDIHDDTVYMDEYISYLVYNYGSAENGGINGYFLDSEPENWAENYAGIYSDTLTAEGLLDKSAGLARAVKQIDPTALVYGPSVNGLDAFVNLKNTEDWEGYRSAYSWFIDYYLDKMSEASKSSGSRLLDVLDLHFISEARSVMLEPIVGTDSLFANEQRIQAPRILWDVNYTENSSSAILYKEHTPLIPNIQASIRMYFPDTKLSFSEYNFGGGNHISGGLAEADTLGIFGRQGVYMACLKPDSRDFFYQKSGINIYTDYDGNGSSFGDIGVSAETSANASDLSAYAAVSSEDEGELTLVIINKTKLEDTLSIKINSGYDYESAEAYGFNGESSSIKKADGSIGIADNTLSFTADPLSVTLLKFKCEEISEDNPGTDNDETYTLPTTASKPETHEHVEVTAQTKQTTAVPDNTQIQTSVSVVGTDNNGSAITEIVTEVVTVSESAAQPEPPEEVKSVPKALKTVGIILTAAVVIAVVLVLLDDGNEKRGRKR